MLPMSRTDLPDSNDFISLHTHCLVVKWVWCFSGTMLRAITDTGLSATIHRDALDDLIAAGLMERGPGFSVRVVDKLPSCSTMRPPNKESIQCPILPMM